MTKRTLFVGKVVDHDKQRYSTCGDWQFFGNTIVITVSDTGSRMSNMLVALHELVEAILCEASGISQQDVDCFDITYEDSRTDESLEEPGDNVSAPYHIQHKIADIVERLTALNANVNWLDHEKNVADLFKESA